MKRFRPAKLTTRIHSRNSKKRLVLPVTVNRAVSNYTASTGSADETRHDEITSDLVQYDAAGSTAQNIGEYEMRRVVSSNNWAAIRTQLLLAFAGEAALPKDATCCICNVKRAESRCLQCGHQTFYCPTCCLELHSKMNHFHTPEVWKDGTFVPLVILHNNNIMRLPYHNRNCHAASKEIKEITIVDIQGNHHFKQYEICTCEKVSVTLLRYGLWPGSPEKPTCAFHLELMELVRVMFIHCKVSLNEMTEALDFTRHKLMPKLIASIYAVLNSGCFEEYRFFHHQLNSLNSLDQRLHDGTWCPLCPQDNGVLIESMDACFGLCRKKAKGSGFGDARHTKTLFADQDDVDNFVDTYPTNGKSTHALNEECSRFHAGEVSSSLRSKGKNKQLDEKALFGRVCRHDYPKGFLNIKHGERISYSVYECKRILDNIKGKENISVIIMYDIACILSSHIKKNPSLKYLIGVPLAIPIFHCYGHKAACQVQFSPRRTKLLGLTDGEGTERLWSFLRDYSRITKEMGTNKRNDVLTDGLIHYGQQLLSKQGVIIKGKLTRTLDLKEKTSKELQEVTMSLPSTFVYSTTAMEDLMSQELQELHSKKTEPQTSWDERYADLLLQHSQLRNEMAGDDDSENILQLRKKSEKLEKLLKQTEKVNGIRKRWSLESRDFLHSKNQLWTKKRAQCLMQMHTVASERTFLLEMKRKYADGQAIAKKLSKMIDQATVSLNKNLAKANALVTETEVSFEDAKNPSSPLYQTMLAEKTSLSSSLPSTLKRKLIDLHCLRERCLEEIDLLSKEVERLTSFYESQVVAINEISSSNTADEGIRSLLQGKKFVILKQLYHLKSILSGVFPDIDFSSYNNPQTYEVATDGKCIYPTDFSPTVSVSQDELLESESGEFEYDEESSSEEEDE